MLRVFFVVATVSLMFALPVAAEKDLNGVTLLNQNDPLSNLGYRSSGATEFPTMAVDLQSCQRACASGTSAVENFCRSLPPDPKMRAACWAVTLGSVAMCNSFCYAWFLLE